MSSDEPPPAVLGAGVGRGDGALLLVTVLFMLAGLVLLVLGFVNDSMRTLYLSIACAAIAGATLIAFSKLSRRRPVGMATGSTGPGWDRPAAAGDDPPTGESAAG